MTDRTVVYRIQANISQLQAQMAQASASVKKFGSDVTATGKSGAQARVHLDRLGKAAGAAGAVAAAGLGLAVKKAADFDEAMSAVQAATHESTQNMELLRAAALKAGADTAFSATEAAGGVEELAKAGVSTADILGGGLAGSLDLAAAGAVSVETASEAAASAMTQFGLAGSSVPHIADLLAAGAGKAQGGVEDLSQALNQSGLVAAQMGISIEDTVGTLSAFASAGLLGSDAGTSFKTMLLSLNPRSKEAANLMEQLGLQAYDTQGNFIGLEAYAGRLQAALGHMSEEQRNATLKTIFGNDAIRAANILYKEGADGIANWNTEINKFGYASDTAATRLDNLKGDLEQLSGSLETALIGTGDGAQGPLRGLVQNLTDVVNAYNKLPGPAKTATGAALGFTAVLGGGFYAYSRSVRFLSDMRESMDKLSVSSPRAAGAMRGLARAGTALIALDAAGRVLDAIREKAVGAAPSVDELTTSLLHLNDAAAADSLTKQVGDLSAALERLSDPGLQNKVFDSVNGFGDRLGYVGNALTGVLDIGTGGGINQAAVQTEQAAQAINSLDEALAGIASQDVDRAKQTFEDFAAAQGLSADQQKQLLELLPQYRGALASTANAQEIETTATEAATSANRAKVTSIKDLVAAEQKKREAALRNRDAELNYASAILDAKEAVKENGKTLDLSTRKGIANRRALDGLASAWNGLSDQAKNTPGAYKAAIDNFVDLAEKMGLSEDKARALAKRLFDLPPKRQVEVVVKTDQAEGALGAIKARLDAIKSKSITITAGYINKGGAQLPADYGQRRASGGYISGPGGPRSDSIPALLSNGEYVVNAAATARHRSLLESINNTYASGGFVGSAPTSGREDVERAVERVIQRTVLKVSGVEAGRAAAFEVGGF